MRFQGFPPQMFEFFMQIAFNNNALFFEDHRKDFERYVKTPLQDFAFDLAPAMQAIDPSLETRPVKVLSRIRRDTRFTKDKSPYRDHLWMSWWPVQGEGRKSNVACFYFGISATDWSVGAGFYDATPETMKAYRAQLQEDPGKLLCIISQPDFSDHFMVHGDDYKRLPKGHETLPDALLPWYLKKSFSVDATYPLDPLLHQPAFAQEVERLLGYLAPFYHYIHALKS